MAKFVFLLSTLTASQLYTTWKKGGGDLPLVERQILVAGGANVADKRLITPRGVVTRISAEDFDLLKTSPAFMQHFEAGYITTSTAEVRDPDRAAEGQTAKDGGAPLTPDDFDPDKAPTSAPATPAAEPAPQPNVRKGK